MQLREMAHARTGDKGNIISISLIARRDEYFEVLRQQVTAERVTSHFAGLVERPALRYEIPHLRALNFVLFRPDDQAVTRSLALDAHGKCLASGLLALEIVYPGD